MVYSWLSISWLPLLPPLFVVIITIATRSVIQSLMGGIVLACLIAAQGNIISALFLSGKRIIEETHVLGLLGNSSLDHLYTFGFLLLLGVLIQLMNHSGGIRAYTKFLLTFIRTKRAAQQTSLILSTTLFIDDYVNNLTVGSIMRPVTDHFTIARAKLAFLLDSMSGPLCMIIPASSWVAFILAQMQASGINQAASTNNLIQQDALFVYSATIPYLLYPLFIVCSAWIIVSCNLSFGSMHTIEKIAAATGNLYGGKQPLETHNQPERQFSGTLLDFIVPIGTFIMGFLCAVAYSGNMYIFGGTSGFIETLQAADPFWALWIASLLAVFVAITLFLRANFSNYFYIAHAFFDGFMLMKNSLIVLLLAWTLSTLLKNDLHTGAYIASLLPTNLSVAYLPALIFLACLIISASTGSVWGTIALMLPITIPLYANVAIGSADFLHMLYPLLGALFSGSVAGSHFSPITDAMIMTSFSAGCYHLDHVKTQMSYAVCPLIGALSGFLILGMLPRPLGYILPMSACIIVGLTVTISLLFIRNAYSR